LGGEGGRQWRKDEEKGALEMAAITKALASQSMASLRFALGKDSLNPKP
jgi:hypothetical protein